MSYIHRFYVNHYRPGENLKNLIEELVIQPYNNHPPTQANEIEKIFVIWQARTRDRAV